MSAAQDHFVAKWHRREPEMALAEVFGPADGRARFRAWGALVTELREAVFELSDPRVTAVKAPWWAEELLRFAEGLGRHPLAADLAAEGAGVPWNALAAAVLHQAQADDRPADGAAALAQMAPLAEALAAAETALFAATLLAAMPEAFDGQPLYRRLRGGLDRAALRRLAAGRGFAPEAAPVTVWRAWRLARRR